MQSRCCGITAPLPLSPAVRNIGHAGAEPVPHSALTTPASSGGPQDTHPVLHPRLTRRGGTLPAGRLPGSVTRVIRAGHFLIYLKLINILLGRQRQNIGKLRTGEANTCDGQLRRTERDQTGGRHLPQTGTAAGLASVISFPSA